MGLALLVIPLFDFGAPIRNERDVKRPLFYYKIVKFRKSGKHWKRVRVLLPKWIGKRPWLVPCARIPRNCYWRDRIRQTPPPVSSKNNVAELPKGSVCDCLIVILTYLCPSTLIMSMSLRHRNLGSCPLGDLLVNSPTFRNPQNAEQNAAIHRCTS